MRKCSTEGCPKPYRARGYCISCYTKLFKIGKLEIVRPRRKNDLCVTCKENKVRPKSSYCKECHTKYENIRRLKFKDEYNRRRRDKYTPELNRRRVLKYQYNMTLEDELELKKKQDYKCAICNLESPLCVDHNHVTEEVRGLLCNNCNNGLGRFKDNSDYLRRAADYIESYNKYLNIQKSTII